MNTAEKIAKLREARDLIAVPGQWTKGAFARDREGVNVSALSPNARAWCIEGALCKAGIGEMWDQLLSDPRERLFRLNDACETAAPMTALLDREIARLGSELANAH
jgi:hypothetical protein